MTPALVGVAVLVLLAFLNLQLGGSILYPPAQFALLWSALAAAAAVWSGTYHPLSMEAVTVFCAGAVSFSAGGALTLLIRQRSPAARLPQPTADVDRRIQRCLTGGLILMVALLPLFWQYLLSVADTRFQNLWLGIRSGMLALAAAQGQKSWDRVFYDNLVILAILLALTAVAYYGDRASSKLVALGLVVVATLYSLATGSRAGAFVVLLGALGIMVLRRGRIVPRHIGAGVLALVVMFVPVTILRMRTGSVERDLQVVGDVALLYSVGPLVSFDEYLQHPSVLPETWSISDAFLRAATRLGFDVKVPSQHLSYVDVGGPWPMNVYTMYLTYFSDFGWIGVMLFPALVGFVTVCIYQLAKEQRGQLLILYGMVFAAICQSGFAESFFAGLNMWFKAALYCLMLHALSRAGKQASAARRYQASPPRIGSCCE